MNVIKHTHRFGALAATAALVLSLCAGCGTSGAEAADLSALRKEEVTYSALREVGTMLPEAVALEGLTPAQQNDWLALYYNESTAAVSVFDKRTGLWWQSNPADATTPAARSQLSIATIDSKGVTKQYTSYTDSLLRNQVTFTVKNGLTVMYTFGNPRSDMSMIPQKLTDARYDELMERIAAAGGDKTLLKRRYTHLDGVWTLKDTLTNDQAKKLRELFELIEYTEVELEQDNAGSSSAVENDSFSIPLTYRLEGDSLRVYVDGEEMIYPENEIITSLDVLEYFGALKQDEEGFLFIPDGSGALVDSKKYGGVSYVSLPLYGRDETLPRKAYSPLGENCLLPVFGINRTIGGMLAVIEDNEAIASVDVVKPGYIDEFATVSAAFALNTVQNIGLASDSISKFYITADTRYAGDTALRYVFLNEADATYAGMAGIYRDYLDKIGDRTLQEARDNIPFFLETVGAIETQVSTLGFVHDTLVPLTTYEDNITLLKALRERGVEDIALILEGWMNGGVDAGLPDSVALIKALGGKKGFAALTDWTSENGVTLYPQVLFNTFSANEGLMTKNAYSAYSLDSKKSYISLYEKMGGTPILRGKRFLLSPAWQRRFADMMHDSLAEMGTAGVNFGDMATTVYSDYNSDSEALRQAARIQSAQITARYADSFDMLLTAPNDLTAVYSRLYTDVPKSSSSLSMTMCSVPFYQMVFHGYAQYSFTAMNYDVDLTRSVLKCAEYGGCPKFQFVAQDGGQASFLESAEYYASYYEEWLDSAGEAYSFLNELLAPVANARMIGHACLAEGVYRTEYDNGMAVYVNYTTESVTVDTVTIGAESAIRKEGLA